MKARRSVAAEIVKAAEQPRRTWPAVVATVTAAGAANGVDAAVTVTLLGDSYPATYYAHYTPVVGHVVRVSLDGNQVHIEGRPLGAI